MSNQANGKRSGKGKGKKNGGMTAGEIKAYIAEHSGELIENGFDSAPREVRDWMMGSAPDDAMAEALVAGFRAQLDAFKAAGLTWTGDSCLLLVGADDSGGTVSMIHQGCGSLSHEAADRAAKAYQETFAPADHLGGYLY